jgi:Fur family peroxide stress response transcriptional regulator
MKISNKQIREKLHGKGLRITPQRIAVLEVIYNSREHPSADKIIDRIRKTHPNIATGTIYKVLDTLVDQNLIRKVNTDKNLMRYDRITEKHHHLFSIETDIIDDYYDKELDKMLAKYFNKKKIPNFKIKDMELQIFGKYKSKKK